MVSCESDQKRLSCLGCSLVLMSFSCGSFSVSFSSCVLLAVSLERVSAGNHDCTTPLSYPLRAVAGQLRWTRSRQGIQKHPAPHTPTPTPPSAPLPPLPSPLSLSLSLSLSVDGRRRDGHCEYTLGFPAPSSCTLRIDRVRILRVS